MNPISTEQIEKIRVQRTPGQELHLLDLLIILAKHRKFILLFTICVAVAATITVFVIPSKFTAQTVVLPPNDNSSMSSALLGQMTGGSSALASIAGAGLGIKSPGEMYVSLFRLPAVEDPLIRRFGLMDRYNKKRMSDTRKVFERRSSVVLGTKDGLIRITVTDWDPNLAAAMANAYVDELRKLTAQLAVTEASRRRLFFQQQLLETNENLVAAEEAMKQMQQQTGVLQVDSQARALIESAAVIRGQIVAKEVELKAMRSYATDDNPQVILAEQQLLGLRAQLAQLAGKDADTNSEIIVPKGQIPSAQMAYIRKLRDLRYQETIKEILTKQFELAKLDEAREGAIVQVADVATPPDKRSFPERTLIICLSGLVGLIGACTWAIFSERFRNLRTDPGELERIEELRSLFIRGNKRRF